VAIPLACIYTIQPTTWLDKNHNLHGKLVCIVITLHTHTFVSIHCIFFACQSFVYTLLCSHCYLVPQMQCVIVDSLVVGANEYTFICIKFIVCIYTVYASCLYHGGSVWLTCSFTEPIQHNHRLFLVYNIVLKFQSDLLNSTSNRHEVLKCHTFHQFRSPEQDMFRHYIV